MSINPFTRTLVALGLVADPRDDEARVRAALAASDGERPTPLTPERVPPHMRHLSAENALLVYSAKKTASTRRVDVEDKRTVKAA